MVTPIVLSSEFISPKEAAVLAGVSRQTVYVWLSTGRLRQYLVAGVHRVNRQELEAFVKQRIK